MHLDTERREVELWEVDLFPAEGQPDRLGASAAAIAAELHLIGEGERGASAPCPDRSSTTSGVKQQAMSEGNALQTEQPPNGGRSPRISAAFGYLIQGNLSAADAQRAAKQLLTDGVVEKTRVARVGDATLSDYPSQNGSSGKSCHLIHVLPKPGVMDPVAESALKAMQDIGLAATDVRTLRKYWVQNLPANKLEAFCNKVLANDAIEQVVVGPLKLDRIDVGSHYAFQKITVPLRSLNDDALMQLSRKQQLSLSLAEMRTIQQHFIGLSRDPTDAELETIAQTWSEHCSHKTLKGRIAYQDENGQRKFQNMLKETIFAATVEIRRQLGDHDWCVSVFEDNAGVVRFDDQFNVVFKVETHNHPSAIEPYGGTNTGLGGVLRDSLGTGLGAKPVCNTDVFCFAPPDFPVEELPPGVLHPRRVINGVVSGVRDYGNRMGIPTVNGAIYFDRRYLGNPLVYCGNVGLLPRDKSRKETRPGDLIVAIGGRTGRDGIHGATFSSIELTHESESLSGGAVQIGNAITEKMLVDVLLQARDRGLFHAVTDCGAGGFSSAVGEMGEKIGAEVQLDRAPLKYQGLSYTEIWISEAQERMVLAVPPEHWPAFRDLCASEGVEATAIGRFVPTGKLQLKYGDEIVADLSMQFLHDGRPPVVREAVYLPSPRTRGTRRVPGTPGAGSGPSGRGAGGEGAGGTSPAIQKPDYTPDLLAILGSYNVASKEWIIRQYDHEVQAGSVVKPLVGINRDGPSDAAVVRPVLTSRRGIVVACGMNPRYGDLDPYHMAASAIDEAVRNCVAVGADPARIAILDNFCWGNTDKPEQLGSLVRAALGCHDVAIGLGTPFISGKDSLNNEFRYSVDGRTETIAIPPSLLISALGQIDDVGRAVTMDLKEPGNYLYQVGWTNDELGGSHFALVNGFEGGQVPQVDAALARKIFAAMHSAISTGLVRACHDLSEGGLAVAAAEMAFAGGCGARIALAHVPHMLGNSPDSSPRQPIALSWVSAKGATPGLYQPIRGYDLAAGELDAASAILLFSESNSRFLCEVAPEKAAQFETAFQDLPCGRIGEVTSTGRLEFTVLDGSANVVDAPIDQLKAAWKAPLGWK